MTITVKSASASYLRRAATIDLLAGGDRTVITATWYSGDVGINGVLWNFLESGSFDGWKLSHRAATQNLQWRYDNGGTNVDIATNTIYGHWLHSAITRNGTTGNTHAYFLLEGFNPISPSYLISPSLGVTNVPVTTSGIWTDYDDQAGYTDAAIGHYIICAAELTEAQALAQFAQRAPISAVTAVSYSYLSCDDPINVEIDAGSTATNYTKTGTFASFASEPSEWASTGMSFQTNFVFYTAN